MFYYFRVSVGVINDTKEEKDWFNNTDKLNKGLVRYLENKFIQGESSKRTATILFAGRWHVTCDLDSA